MTQEYKKAKLIIIRNGRAFKDCKYLLGHDIILIKEEDEEYLVPFNSIEYIKKETFSDFIDFKIRGLIE